MRRANAGLLELGMLGGLIAAVAGGVISVAQPAAAEPVAGDYSGVSPGGGKLPPRAPKASARGPVRVTWTGFQVREGVPTVFVELTGPVVWSLREHDDELVYTLQSVTIPLSNNRRPLDVTGFGTAVSGVEARRRGKDVEVAIRLHQKVGHKERNEVAAGGYKLLVIELSPT